MAVLIKHKKTATFADQPGVEINKGEWNDNHDITGLAAVATSGAYADLTGKPTLGTLAALNAVDLTANVTGILPVPNGGTGAASYTANEILFGAGTAAIAHSSDLTWSATTGLLSQKGISSNPIAGSGSEVFGLGAVDNSNAGASAMNTIIGAGAKVGTSATDCEQNVVIGNGSNTGNFAFFNTVIGAGASSTNSNSVVIGKGNSSSVNAAVVVGSGCSVSATGATSIGFGVSTTHTGSVTLGTNASSERINELLFGSNNSASALDCSFRLAGSTGSFVSRDMSRIGNTWIDSTDATRKARSIFYVDDTAEREYMRADANGSGVDIFMKADVSPLSSAGFSLGTATLPWKQLFVDYTNSATVGNVTIDKISGTCNMAALANTLTVTNNLVTANSRIMATLASDPGVALSIWCVGAAGSFTVNTRPATVNQTAIDFVVFP